MCGTLNMKLLRFPPQCEFYDQMMFLENLIGKFSNKSIAENISREKLSRVKFNRVYHLTLRA